MEYAGQFPEWLEGKKEREDDHPTESRVYESEIGPIEVKSKLFMPSEDEKRSEFKTGKNIIVLGGYGSDPDFESAGWLSQAYADAGNQAVYAVTTRTEKADQDNSLFYEAESVVKLIQEKNLTDVLLVGYSQGGKKAMEAVAIIQEKFPQIKIDRGMVILNAPGLYEQSSKELVGNFFYDALTTKKGYKASQAGSDTTASFVKELKTSGLGVLKRIKGDVQEMAGKSNVADKIKIPIVLVSAEQDKVSKPSKIIPNNIAMEENREEYLKKNIFPQSPYVRMVIGKKEGHHGMPTYRSEEVAKTSLYMLERYDRQEKPAS